MEQEKDEEVVRLWGRRTWTREGLFSSGFLKEPADRQTGTEWTTRQGRPGRFAGRGRSGQVETQVLESLFSHLFYDSLGLFLYGLAGPSQLGIKAGL